MDKDTLETILDVLTTPLDVYDRAIEAAEDGVIKLDDPKTLERLKGMKRDYDQDLRKLRARFLEAILIEGRVADEAMVSFYLEFAGLAIKHAKLDEPLELRVDQAVWEQRRCRIRESFLEGPKEYALPPAVVDIILNLVDAYNDSGGHSDNQAQSKV